MIDPILTPISIVFYMATWVFCTYMMVYFTHPDDRNVAFFPKVVVVMGLTLSVTNILLLPLDVGSTASDYEGLPMDVIWLSVQILMAVLVVLIIPFSYFYYSNYDPYSKKKPIKKAFIGTFVIFILFAVLCVVGYIYLGVAEVPIEVIEVQSVVNATRRPQANDCPECNFVLTDGSIYNNTRQSFTVSFVIFFITVIALFGYLLFVLFAGIGLIALPQQLIQNYRWRPRPISADEWKERQISIGTRAASLIATAKEFQKKKPWRSQFNKYKKEVLALEDEFKYTKQAHKLKGKHIIYYILCLIGGIAGVLLTLMWLLHIVLFNLFNIDTFLNGFFLLLDGAVSFFGTFFFGLFGFYLLWCVVEGVLKFGLRIPFIFAIHPIKKKETYMDAWLFNSALIQLASVGVSYFLSLSFTIYGRLSANNAIFNLSVYNMRGLRYIWYWMYWVLIGITVLSFVYFAQRPVGFKKRLQHTRSKRLKRKYELQPLNTNKVNNMTVAEDK